MDVTVESAVETEVAQVGGRPLEIFGVIAEDGDGDAGFICGGGGYRISNIENEFVIAAYVRADHDAADKHMRGLPGAFEIEQGAAILDGVGDGQMRAIPAVTAIVGRIGIAGVIFIKAV